MNFLNTKTAMIVAGVLAGGLVLYVLARKAGGAAGEAAGRVADAVSPVNPDNVFAGTVNAIGDALDNAENDNSFSLGGWIYDLTHREYDPNAMQRSDDRAFFALNSEEIS